MGTTTAACATRGSGVPHLVALGLQLSAFTLAGGGGLHLGWAFLRKRGPFVGPAWFRLPKRALVDVAWLYVLIVPLFALGSLGSSTGPLPNQRVRRFFVVDPNGTILNVLSHLPAGLMKTR